MRFRTWFGEEAASLGSLNPDPATYPLNKGSATPASDGVLKTGLQPQVDAQEIDTKQKDEQDAIQSLDSTIQQFDQEIPRDMDEESPKINRFKELWKKLRDEWEDIKIGPQDEGDPDAEDGLGAVRGDPNFLKTMRQHPNAMLNNPQSFPHGPGTFGVN